MLSRIRTTTTTAFPFHKTIRFNPQRRVNTSVHLHGLPTETTEEDVLELANGFGTLTELVLIPRKQHETHFKSHKAILTFEESYSAIAAVNELHHDYLPLGWPFRKQENDPDEIKQHEQPHEQEQQQCPTLPPFLSIFFETSHMKKQFSNKWVMQRRVFSRSRLKLLHRKRILQNEIQDIKYELHLMTKKKKKAKQSEVVADDETLMTDRIAEKERQIQDIVNEIAALPSEEDWRLWNKIEKNTKGFGYNDTGGNIRGRV